MRRLASIAVLLAVGLACGPQGYQNSPFDTEDPLFRFGHGLTL